MAIRAKLWISGVLGSEVCGVFGVDVQPGTAPLPPFAERFRFYRDANDLFPEGFEVGFALKRPSEPSGMTLEECLPVGEERQALLERFGVEPWHGRDLSGLEL